MRFGFSARVGSHNVFVVGLIDLYTNGNAGTDEQAFDLNQQLIAAHAAAMDAVADESAPTSLDLENILAKKFESSPCVCSDHMRYFLWDSSQNSIAQEETPSENKSYADFLLQPFDMENTYIPR